jgi:integrase
MSEPEGKDPTSATSERSWSRKKRDRAPRGIRQLADRTWGIRYACALKHLHKERVGTVKRDAIAVYHERRARAMSEPGWCPQAERQQAREEAARQREAARLESERTVTVKQYAERWLKVHVEPECRERTARQYRSVLEGHVYPAFGAVPMRDLRRRDLRAFIAEKQASGLTRGTLKNIFVPLVAMLNAAVDDEDLSGNPAAGLWNQRRRARTEEEAKKVTALSAEELARILRAADEHAPEHTDILHVLAWTGCRLSEACGLHNGETSTSRARSLRFAEQRPTARIA